MIYMMVIYHNVVVFYGMGINYPKLLLCNCAFRYEGGKNLLAITIEAWDLVANKPMEDMGFQWFP